MDDEHASFDADERRRRPPRGWLVVAAVAVVVAAAVLIAVRATRGSVESQGSAGGAADPGLTTQQVISLWDGAVRGRPHPLMIVGYGSTTQVGDWEPLTGANNKQAMLSGLATLGPDVTDRRATGSSRGTVRLTDGTSRDVGVLGAQATARLLIAESGAPQACDGCTPVVLTGPRRTTAAVSTATGPATVPAWSFGVAGSAVRFVQAAVDPADLLQDVPGLPYGLGSADTTVHVESDGRLTVRWTGVPSVAQAGGCGRDYRLEFADGESVLVLRFVELPVTGTDRPQGCSASASVRRMTVQPPHALGGRILVQDVAGAVVPRV